MHTSEDTINDEGVSVRLSFVWEVARKVLRN